MLRNQERQILAKLYPYSTSVPTVFGMIQNIILSGDMGLDNNEV